MSEPASPAWHKWRDLIERQRASGTGAITRTVTHYYDGDGRLIEKLTYGPGKVVGVDSPDEQLRYEYHAATGRLVRTYTGPTAAPISDVRYGYDQLGRLKSVTVEKLNGAVPSLMPATIRYDAVGNSMGTTTLPNTVYTYDLVGNLDTVTAPNLVVHDYDYDVFHRLDVLTVKKTATGPNLVKYDYQVFADGQRDYVDETSYDATGIATGTVRTDWGYDNLDRLISEQYASLGQPGYYRADYAYNEVGNRLSKIVDKDGTTSDETINYTLYDRNDRLITETSTLSGTTTYGYDNNGSMTSRIKGAQNDIYGFDFRNRMTSATVAGVSSTFGYDSAGNRVSKTVSGASTHFLVDANNPTGYSQVVQESAALGGSPSASFVYGSDLIYQNRGGADAYYGYDGSGNARLLTNTSAAITDTYRYDAFGVLEGSTGTTANDYRFAGERLETATGNIHLRARDYNASTGRFTSFDSYEGRTSDPRTLHKYTYAAGNPIYFADPGGHEFSVAGVLAATGIRGLLSGLYEVGFGAAYAMVEGSSRGLNATQVFAGFLVDQAMGLGIGAGISFLGSIFGSLTSGSFFSRFADEGGAGLVGKFDDASRMERSAFHGEGVFFGQRKASPVFSDHHKVPPHLRNRLLDDVVADLKSGAITPDMIQIQVFRDANTGKLVSANTRSLAALSEAGFKPTNVVEVAQPSDKWVRRLKENPLIADAPLPGPHVPIGYGETKEDFALVRVVSVPGYSYP